VGGRGSGRSRSLKNGETPEQFLESTRSGSEQCPAHWNGRATTLTTRHGITAPFAWTAPSRSRLGTAFLSRDRKGAGEQLFPDRLLRAPAARWGRHGLLCSRLRLGRPRVFQKRVLLSLDPPESVPQFGAHRQDGLDPVVLLEPSHLCPVDETALQDEDLDHVAAQGVQHEGTVVVQGDRVHDGLGRRAAGRGGGSRSVFSNWSMVASMRR